MKQNISAVNLILKLKPVNWKAITGSYRLPDFVFKYNIHH